MNVQILPLNKEELSFIPDWTRDWITAVNPSAFPLTTFSCPGYSNYLTLQCSLPWKINATRIVGAYDGTTLLGFVEYILMENTLFINNIYLKPDARGKGVAKQFLEYASRLANENDLSSVSLDCFLWNKNALERYLNWGFEKRSSTYWYVGENPFKHSNSTIQYFVDGYANTELNQQTFGFSTIQIRTSEWKNTIGRISHKYFRIIDKSQSIDPNLLMILAELDTNRDLFIISPFSELPDQPFLQQVSSSARMELVL